SATPDLLMEPALNTSLSQDPDLTVEQFADIGWFTPAAVTGVGGPPLAVPPRVSGFPNPTRGAASIVYSLPSGGGDRGIGGHEPGSRIVARFFEAHAAAGRHAIHWDGRDLGGRQVPAGVYSYRLRTPRYVQGNTVVVVR